MEIGDDAEQPRLEQGQLIVFSGPSGVGKGTLKARVLQEAAVPLVEAVSATTRSPRPGEVNGRDYYYLSGEEFKRRYDSGEFLEAFEVFGRGVWYGTLRSEVETILASGRWVLLEIDVQGMLAIKQQFPAAITIFIRPETIEQLEQRLRDRQTESEEELQRRLGKARSELAQADKFDYQVINNQLEDAVAEVRQIIQQRRTDSTNHDPGKEKQKCTKP